MAKKKRGKEQPLSLAEIRGVETFETNDIVVLVLGDVGRVAEAFVKWKKAKVWQSDVLGKTVKITDPCYLVLRMAGHPWTVITACNLSKKSFFKADDAKAMSKAMKTKAIYFGNSDTASCTEYELFDAGKRLEHFRCFEKVEFASEVRDVEPPEDGPDIYDFVSRFMREQDAFVPACSFHLAAGWMKAGQKLKIESQEEMMEEAIERVDFVAVGG